jgi:hypothetical protein
LTLSKLLSPHSLLLGQAVRASSRSLGLQVSSSRVRTSPHPVRTRAPQGATTPLQGHTRATGPQRGSPLRAHLQACTRILRATGIVIVIVIVTNSESFLRRQPLLSHSKNSQHSMVIEGSLPCSQESAAGPYPEPDESSPHPATYFSKENFNTIFPATCRFPSWPLSFRSS